MELWSYPWKRWNPGSIFIHIGILIFPLQIILVFYPCFYKHRNSDLILSNIGIRNSIIVILALFFQTLEFLSHSFTANIEILAPSFGKCEFLFVCFFKHRNSYLILRNTGILALFFIHISCVILFFKTLRLWPYFCKYWNYDLIVAKVGMVVVFLYTLEFLSFRSKYWYSDPIYLSIGILISFFQTLEF